MWPLTVIAYLHRDDHYLGKVRLDDARTDFYVRRTSFVQYRGIGQGKDHGHSDLSPRESLSVTCYWNS